MEIPFPPQLQFIKYEKKKKHDKKKKKLNSDHKYWLLFIKLRWNNYTAKTNFWAYKMKPTVFLPHEMFCRQI